MQIRRIIADQVINKLTHSNKAVILYGPRQVGKTTLCNTIIELLGLRTLSINADEQRFIDVLASRDSRKLLELVNGYHLLFIDEAQRIPDIGINLKILIDNSKGLKILATGSSSFELANTISEPLTGRKWTFQLFPIAQVELTEHFNEFELKSQLEERLIWGSYPELFQLSGLQEKMDYLRELTSDYLYKDLLTINDVRQPDKIRNLLKLLAFQIGNEVSLSELASHLDMSKETVARYIDLLEKTFVILRLSGFSRNLRKEISKTCKYYFYDLGIRNAIIDNLKSLQDRNDIGGLWENFLVIERIKRNRYNRLSVLPYFWRTYTGSEIDYVEEVADQLFGFEIKWMKKSARAPKSWLSEYRGSRWELVHNENWLTFVT